MTHTTKKSAVGGAIISLVALLSTAAFLYIGFVMHIWHPTWLVFLSIPIVSAIVDIATCKRNLAGAVSGIVSIGCAVAYLYMGFILNLWHPGWLIFFAIPITHALIKIFTGGDAQQPENQSASEAADKEE